MLEPICPECLKELRHEKDTFDHNFGFYHCDGCRTQVVMQNAAGARTLGRDRENAALRVASEDKSGFPHQSTK